MKSCSRNSRFAAWCGAGIHLALVLGAFAQPQLILPFDPGAPDQDVVLATRPGIHGTEAQSQAAEVYQGRIYYAVYSDGSSSPSKVLCFNPTDNSVTTIAQASANMFRAIKVMNGLLWISHINGGLWTYDGIALQQRTLTPFTGANSVSSMTELNGKMYFATSAGHIYESSDGGTFIHRRTITAGKGINALTTWNGYIYGGNTEDYSYSAKIFRSSDGVNWTILGTYNTYNFYGFVPTPTHLYLASVEDAGWASFAIRATTDGTTWSRIFYTDTEGKGLNGRPQYFSQTGRAYFSSEWFYPNPSHVTRIFPAINGAVEARTILQHGHSSFVEVDGQLYAIGAQARDSWGSGPHVVSRLGKYVALPSDDDGDGVPDTEDSCPNTAIGEIVNTNGCSIAQIVPASGVYRNHGEYVSRVARVAGDFLAQGLITQSQMDAIIASAARSDTGKPPRIHAIAATSTGSGANTIELKWMGTLGKRYRIEQSSHPAGPFSPVARDLGGTPPENVYRTVVSPSAPAAFYRVVEEGLATAPGSGN